MDDRSLEKLIRMAVEIDELEAELRTPAAPSLTNAFRVGPRLAPGQASRSGAPRRRHTLRWFASMAVTAAAACIAAAWFWTGQVEPTGTHSPPVLAEHKPMPSRTDGTTRFAVAPPASGDSYVVLSIFRTWDGECQCRSWRVHRLAPGKTLAQMETGELLDAALASRCVESVERLMVVALAGRPEELPMQSDQAESLLECMELSPNDADRSTAAMTQSCVPGGLTVRTQFVSVNPHE